MKKILTSIGRFFSKTAAKAVVIVLVILMLPFGSQLLEQILPDPGAAAIRISEVLQEKLSVTTRLETNLLEQACILESSVSVPILGQVRDVKIHYDYTASIGIDLAQIHIQTKGADVILQIPALEILSDSLTPTKTERNDFWYPLTEKQRAKLLNEELTNRRSMVTEEIHTSDEMWNNSVKALSELIGGWLKELGGYEHIIIEPLPEKEEDL